VRFEPAFLEAGIPQVGRYRRFSHNRTLRCVHPGRCWLAARCDWPSPTTSDPALSHPLFYESHTLLLLTLPSWTHSNSPSCSWG
jgi:hypothetical protein